jgi:3-phenylpropionate/trans-cinnamate dioxygenase ferredoxin reductase subunit
MNAPILIIGAGQAAIMAAEALRSGGYTGPLTLLGDEPHAPYHRPPLSKAFLAGEMDATRLPMRTPEMLAGKNIELRTGTKATAIDRTAKTVTLADGSTLPYGGLLLATGSTPRTLSLPGANAQGVLALRTRDDADAIAQRMVVCLEKNLPLVVIGGGVIGLEVAATARKKGLAVTVLEAAPRLLARMLQPQLSDWYAELHRSHGVQLLLGAQIAAIEHDASKHVTGVRMADGTVHPAGLVLVGIGVNPNEELARAAGLECERGIVVDACGRTSDPAITAAGDCTARRLPDGSLIRLESVQNATELGKSAAAALLGQERPFTATPWFWSDQYDKKLQMAGLSAGADQQVLRGDMAGSFSLFHYKGEQLIAIDNVNNPKEHLLVRKLMDAGISPTPAQAADVGFDLNGLMSK